ncbi:MAG: creatininase family protein [Candidatus Sumerlaeia bacterium]
MIEPWNLAATNLGRLQDDRMEVAVLPTGAIEAHNRHLPEGQDFLHTTHVARASAAAAWERGARVVCLPTLPYGVDCNLLDFPLSIHVSQAALDAMIRDIIVSLRRHGIRKVVILNGHGGNDFTPFIRQIQCDTDVHVFVVNWWTVGNDRYGEIFDEPDDHAGEMETSVALALYPELVEMDRAGDGVPAPFRLEALREGWARTSRRFSRLTDHCAAGDPRLATPEKGKAYLELVCGRISDFLVELANSEIDENFPQG